MKTIVVTAFDRPKLLEDCLKSIRSANSSNSHKVIIVLQSGNEECARLLETFRSDFTTVIQSEGSGSTVDSKITNNRILGLYTGFEFWKSDYVLALEDDAVISRDALTFVDYAYQKYKNNPWFRGVNLGSTLPYAQENENSYSLLRFGVHGPASMITRRTWEMLNLRRIMGNHERIFDSQIEFIVKTGFMVTPNVSRFRDQGFIGTHTSKSSHGGIFIQRINSSFGNIENSAIEKAFVNVNIDPKWRGDCIVYRFRENPIYWGKAKLYPISYKFPKFLFVKSLLKRKIVKKASQ